MGITIKSAGKTKMPRAYRLASQIASYLFEEENGECRYMEASEIEAIKKANKAIGMAIKRSDKC